MLDPPALELEASGTFWQRRWTLEGRVPRGTVRIVVVTSDGHEVEASCGQERWCAYLKPGHEPRDATVCARSASGVLVATERLLLNPPRLLPSRRRRVVSWLRHHTGRGPHGSVTYGPN